uniref:Small ribosomal subunit protein bS6m n=1 Tax=Mus spicilegus TaxID=10103 RepID=A0A8C6GRY1_MUSSI
GRPGKFHRVPEPKVGRRGGGGERVRAERGDGLRRAARDRVHAPQARGTQTRPRRAGRQPLRCKCKAPSGRGAGRCRVGGALGGRGEPSAQLPEPLNPASRGRTVLSQPARELTGRVPLSSSSAPRVPALATPALLDSAPPTWAMPRYELALILKAMRRPETAAALKRTIESLMDRGAIVRNLESLGERALPYRISSHSQQHSRGGYFLVDFYAPTSAVENILEHLVRDIDVVRPNIVKHPLTQEVKECDGIVPVPLEEKLYSTKRRKK